MRAEADTDGKDINEWASPEAGRETDKLTNVGSRGHLGGEYAGGIDVLMSGRGHEPGRAVSGAGNDNVIDLN